MALLTKRSTLPSKDGSKEKGSGPVQLLSKSAPGTGEALARGRIGAGSGAGLPGLMRKFYKKDMAVISSALGVLLLAPIADHFMSQPADNSQLIQPGFDSKNAGSDGTNPFEPGAGGSAPGSASWVGNNSKITPLNVRDPGYLIIPDHDDADAPGPAAAAAAPKGDQGWGSVVRDAAKKGASAAINAATGSKVKSAVAGVLKDLPSLASSSEHSSSPAASSAPPPVPVNHGPSHGGPDDSFSLVSAAPSYRGVAARGANFNSLLSPGGSNRSGTSAVSFGSSGSPGVAGGGSGTPGGNIAGGGHEDGKGSGANPAPKAPAQPGQDSLAEMKQKLDMENAEKLAFEKAEWNQIGKQKMEEQAEAQGIWQLAAAGLQSAGSAVGGMFGGGRNANSITTGTNGTGGSPPTPASGAPPTPQGSPLSTPNGIQGSGPGGVTNYSLADGTLINTPGQPMQFIQGGQAYNCDNPPEGVTPPSGCQ